ncbi:MAG: A/G-specific adenine glycosylase [Verrucomicrobiales bacterium]|jgi:A/G-specific adenine glycosylase
MLQQTRVDQVVPYFERFLKRFPTIKALAEADQQEVLKAWEGLGYYARARNLHKTAIHLHTQCQGRFPKTYEDLLALPGIGPYTAAAISSLAYGSPHAVLDGNVIRVLSRVFAFTPSVSQARNKQRLQEAADALLPLGNAAAFNEGVMELGATVCMPRKPLCLLCPIKTVCKGQHDPHAYPVKDKKKPIPTVVVGAAAIFDRSQRVLIARRHQKGLLGGLWEFPGGKLEPGESLEACTAREIKEELGVDISVGEKLMIVHHTYSHFKLEMHVFICRIVKGRPRAVDCADFAWCTLEELDAYPYSKADLYVVDALKRQA